PAPRGAGRPGRQLGFQLLAPPLAFTEAVRLPVENQNVRPVRNPVQQCCRQRRVAKHLLPAGKLQVAGHDEAAGLVPFRHELEEQRRPRPQPQVPQFVTDDQVELLPALEVTIQPYLLLSRQQLLGQRDRADEPDPVTRLDGGDAQRSGNMGLACSAGPQANHVFLGGYEIGLRQLQHLGLGQLWYRVEFKLLQRLELRKLGGSQPCLQPPAMPRSQFLFQAAESSVRYDGVNSRIRMA